MEGNHLSNNKKDIDKILRIQQSTPLPSVTKTNQINKKVRGIGIAECYIVVNQQKISQNIFTYDKQNTAYCMICNTQVRARYPEKTRSNAKEDKPPKSHFYHIDKQRFNIPNQSALVIYNCMKQQQQAYSQYKERSGSIVPQLIKDHLYELKDECKEQLISIDGKINMISVKIEQQGFEFIVQGESMIAYEEFQKCDYMIFIYILTQNNEIRAIGDNQQMLGIEGSIQMKYLKSNTKLFIYDLQSRTAYKPVSIAHIVTQKSKTEYLDNYYYILEEQYNISLLHLITSFVRQEQIPIFVKQDQIHPFVRQDLEPLPVQLKNPKQFNFSNNHQVSHQFEFISIGLELFDYNSIEKTIFMQCKLCNHNNWIGEYSSDCSKCKHPIQCVDCIQCKVYLCEIHNTIKVYKVHKYICIQCDPVYICSNQKCRKELLSNKQYCSVLCTPLCINCNICKAEPHQSNCNQCTQVICQQCKTVSFRSFWDQRQINCKVCILEIFQQGPYKGLVIQEACKRYSQQLKYAIKMQNPIYLGCKDIIQKYIEIDD